MPGRSRAAYEKITAAPSSSFTLKRISGTRFEAPYHYHPELELTWIVRSSGQRFVGDSVAAFRTGDLVLLGPNLPHVWLNPPSCRQAEAVVVHFAGEFLGPHFFQLPEFRAVGTLLARSARGLTFSAPVRRRVIAELEAMEKLRGAERVICLLDVLVLLAGDRGADLLCSPRYAPQHDPAAGERINAVYRELTARFREAISQPEIARRIGLTAAVFSRFFRRMTGRGFAETLNDVRLGHACELLRETDRSVAEICFDSGFRNLANFNRQFRRRYKSSPREWRARTGDA